MDRSRDPNVDRSDMPLTSTTNEIGFHTDIGDIVSNLMIQPAANGGVSYFASGTQVYNDLASKRPDIIHRLTGNWSYDIFPSETGQKPALERPLLYNSGVHATMLCFRQPFVTSAPNNLRQGNLPEISSAQKEALDAIHYTASDKAIALNLVRGDLIFVNNLLVLHARGGYTDQGMPRHVQRLIVRDPIENWRVPVGLRDIWGMIFGNPDHEWKNEVFNLDDLRGQRALWKLNG
ncbi:MAG: hypothetical protein M1840_007049 [Geoglossum simile]|nr:MAG: hypothetical protein M1840_007049 [Geoglossum simile]